MAVAFAIATEVFGDAVAALALERSVLTGESFAVEFVASVVAVVVVITAVPSGNTLAVSAPEFRVRALPVLIAAEFLVLVVSIRTIVFEIAGPAARNAALVLTLEFRRFVALGAVFGHFIASVTTIVLSIAEQPLRNAAVVAPLGTAAPSGGAVALAANVSRFVASVSAVVVGIAVPRLLDAAAVLAGEFRFRIARAGVTNCRIFVASVAAVVVSVTFPGAQDAAAGRVALEFVLRTRNVAVPLVGSISAIVHSVAQGGGRGAVVVVALELSGFAEALLASSDRFVGSVLAILLSIALPVERNAAVVLASAPVLSGRAVGDAAAAIRSHEELVGAGAFEADRSVFVRRQQAQAGTSAVVASARIRVR